MPMRSLCEYCRREVCGLRTSPVSIRSKRFKSNVYFTFMTHKNHAIFYNKIINFVYDFVACVPCAHIRSIKCVINSFRIPPQKKLIILRNFVKLTNFYWPVDVALRCVCARAHTCVRSFIHSFILWLIAPRNETSDKFQRKWNRNNK